MVLFGFKTIHSGEQALVRNYQGDARLIVGPARVTLWRSHVEKLLPFYARDGQYLEVNHKNGPRQSVMGPVQMFLNPLDVEAIHVKDATLVSANEALVVYRSKDNKLTNHTENTKQRSDVISESFERIVLHGPIRYVPQPGEWTHEFSWHGSDPQNKARKVKGALSFTKLRVIADQFYYNIPEVRTKDDTMIVVKLMIFFQLENVEKMLDNTHDPIADFINSATSDTIQYCSGLSYEEFVDNTSKMNDLETFEQLRDRAEMIGYKINKVVFRGFHSSDALQNMHDKAIQERTRLRLEADTEDHRQRTLDLQLVKEEERSVKERELEKEREEHERMMEREKHMEQLRRETERAEHAQELQEMSLVKTGERAARERELERLTEEHKLKILSAKMKLETENEKQVSEVRLNEKKMLLELEKQRLEELSKLGVDITQVLVAECRAADKTVKIDNASGPAANIHLHDDVSSVKK